jgi:hypothetical protein
MAENHEWTVGEKVARFYRGNLSGIATIAKLTKTQVVTTEKERFNYDGTEIGARNYEYARIEPLKDEHLDVLKHHSFVKWIKSTEFEKLPTETLGKIYAYFIELGVVQEKK